MFGRTAYTEALTKIKGGGDLEKYLGVSALRPFIPLDLVLEGMVAFSLPEVEGLARGNSQTFAVGAIGVVGDLRPIASHALCSKISAALTNEGLLAHLDFIGVFLHKGQIGGNATRSRNGCLHLPLQRHLPPRLRAFVALAARWIHR